MLESKSTFVCTLFSGVDNNSSEVHLGRMLQILREFSADPVLSVYVIDDVWEYMKAMKVCYFQEPRKEMKNHVYVSLSYFIL